MKQDYDNMLGPMLDLPCNESTQRLVMTIQAGPKKDGYPNGISQSLDLPSEIKNQVTKQCHSSICQLYKMAMPFGDSLKIVLGFSIQCEMVANHTGHTQTLLDGTPRVPKKNAVLH